jgi:MFS family permease
MSENKKTEQKADNSTKRYTLLSVFLTILLDLVGFGMFIPILPSLARALKASDAQSAYLSAIFSFGTLLSVMVLGKLSDQIGRRKILITTILLSLSAQALTGLTPMLGSYFILALIRFLAGVAAGNISVAQAVIADITPLHERSRAMVLVGVAFGAGFALGPALGALISYLSPDNPIVPISLTAAALNLLNLLLIVFRFKETHHRFAHPSLSGIISEAQRGSENSDTEKTGARRTAALLLNRPFFKTVLVMQFIQVFGFVGVETILPLVLSDSYGKNQTGIYNSFLFLGMVVLLSHAGLSRPFLKKAGEKITLNAGQLSLTLGIFLIPLLAPDSLGLYAALTFLSLGSSLSNPALSGLVSRLSPRDRQGFALGMAQSLSAGARILGPAFMGLMYEKLNGAPSLYISGGLLLIVTLIGMAGLRGLPPTRAPAAAAEEEAAASAPTRATESRQTGEHT